MTIVKMLAATLILGTSLVYAENDATQQAPKAPSSTMGPTSGSDASQTTPSLGGKGKEVFNKLDADKDGSISKAEAKRDAAMTQGFDEADENKNEKLDAGEFARSKSAAAPAESAVPVK